MKKNTIKNNKMNVASSILFAILLIYVISFVFQISWALITSVKGSIDYLENPLGFPSEFHFENYGVALNNFVETIFTPTGMKYIYIEDMIFNSLLYAVGCAFFVTVSPFIVSYCCARYAKFKISSVYVGFVLVCMSLPIIGSQPSELKMLMNLGLYDTMFGLWFMKCYFMGTYFLVFYAMFKSMSKDYSEAASIDGAGPFTIFFKIYAPMAVKTFSTVMLIQFVAFWNDYFVPMLYMPSHYTLAYGLYKYTWSNKPEISSTPMKMAGCMILFLPIFIIFVSFQKVLIGNISVGGLKE